MKNKLFFLLMLLFSFGAYAQWTSDTEENTLVSTAITQDTKSATASDGSTYVVYWKPVGSPQNYELMLQVLDSDGNQTLGDEGVLISDSLPMFTYTVTWNIIVDENDDIYVGVTATDGSDGYVFKLDMEGNILWSIENINTGLDDAQQVKPFPLSNGETLISWSTSSKSKMQKYDANGNSIWQNPIEIGETEKTAVAEMFELSDGSVEVIYHSVFGEVESNVYAQRFDMNDGSELWDEETQLSNFQTRYNKTYTAAQDGDLVFFGYKAAIGSRFDSFLQRVNPDGSTPWGINGSDFDLSDIYFEQETEIATEEGSQYVWAICNYTDSSQGLRGIFVQKFDKDTGDRVFGNLAKELYPVDASLIMQIGKVRLVNGSPLFLVYSSDEMINITHLDSHGDFAWEGETDPISTNSLSKGRISLGKIVEDQIVATFVTSEGDDSGQAYAQNYTNSDFLSIKNVSQEFTLKYNNPVQGKLQLQSEKEIKSIKVFNMLGKLISSKEFEASKNLSLNTQNWNTGIFLVTLETQGGHQQTIKIIKD